MIRLISAALGGFGTGLWFGLFFSRRHAQAWKACAQDIFRELLQKAERLDVLSDRVELLSPGDRP